MIKNEEEFLIGLEKLTRVTGIAIAGCGCCGSPSLVELEKNSLHKEAGYCNASNVMWVSKNDEYDWGEYSNNIIKQQAIS